MTKQHNRNRKPLNPTQISLRKFCLELTDRAIHPANMSVRTLVKRMEGMALAMLMIGVDREAVVDLINEHFTGLLIDRSKKFALVADLAARAVGGKSNVIGVVLDEKTGTYRLDTLDERVERYIYLLLRSQSPLLKGQKGAIARNAVKADLISEDKLAIIVAQFKAEGKEKTPAKPKLAAVPASKEEPKAAHSTGPTEDPPTIMEAALDKASAAE